MTKTILVMGQSNAIGRISGPLTTCADVTVWNSTNDIDTLSSLGTAFQAANLSNAPHVGGKPMFATAAAKYLSELIGEPVRVISVAKGATSIDQWMNSSGTAGAMYARMEAVLAAAGVTSLDAFLWHQGESDTSTTGTYAARFGLLLDRMETDGYITATTPIVIGEISNIVSLTMNGVLRGIAAARSNVGIACVGQFFTPTSDTWHFEGYMQAKIGLEYAYELSQLSGPWANTWCQSQPVGKFVFATGIAVSIPDTTDVIVPLRRKAGDTSMINSSGVIVVPVEGVWRIDIRAWGDGGRTYAKLLDANANPLDFLAYSGQSDATSNNAIVAGSSYIRLWRGDAVCLGVRQGSGSNKTIAHEYAERHIAMSAEFVAP